MRFESLEPTHRRDTADARRDNAVGPWTRTRDTFISQGEASRTIMFGFFIDVLALRRTLWACAVGEFAVAAFRGEGESCAIVDFDVIAYRKAVAFGILGLTLEAASLVLFKGAPGYCALRLGVPVLQIPPVARTASSTISTFSTGLVLVAFFAALTFSTALCSAWPMATGAFMAGAPHAILLLPLFGQEWFWRLHYRLLLGPRGYEEWFCTAEVAAAIALAHMPDVTSSRVLVVGSGASRVPELLASCGPSHLTVRALDASAAAMEVMRARAPQGIEWKVADVTSAAAVAEEGSVDLVVDKGTFAALQEKSPEAFADGFANAYRALRPGGVLVTIIASPHSPRASCMKQGIPSARVVPCASGGPPARLYHSGARLRAGGRQALTSTVSRVPHSALHR